MAMKELGEAIKASSTPPKVAFLGFDLWLEVFSSGKVRNQAFKKGGVLATPEDAEDESVITILMPVVGRNIVISFDPTLGPDDYRLVS